MITPALYHFFPFWSCQKEISAEEDSQGDVDPRGQAKMVGFRFVFFLGESTLAKFSEDDSNDSTTFLKFYPPENS